MDLINILIFNNIHNYHIMVYPVQLFIKRLLGLFNSDFFIYYFIMVVVIIIVLFHLFFLV